MTARGEELSRREDILDLLTDLEVDRAGHAETVASLDDGDEFIDLDRLGDGIQRANGVPVRPGAVLPRKAVEARTWSKIIGVLVPKAVASAPRRRRPALPTPAPSSPPKQAGATSRSDTPAASPPPPRGSAARGRR